jgi:tetratricopeptide (TPR) repeat protein
MNAPHDNTDARTDDAARRSDDAATRRGDVSETTRRDDAGESAPRGVVSESARRGVAGESATRRGDAPVARSSSGRKLARRDLLLASSLVACLLAAAGVSRWLELRRPPAGPAALLSEDLYLSPRAARRMSLAFNGLAADWYWLRTLQYVGRKVTAHRGPVQIDDLRALELRALAPLLEHTTTLDPQFLTAYEYGAVVLPAVDTDAAVRLVEKGIRENPRAWRLHSYLGYIYWQQGRHAEASAAYSAGSRVPGAPAWMAALAAQMSAKGGSRDTARAIYETMLRTTDDEQMRAVALRRLLQLRSLDERDALGRLLSAQRERAGRCPRDWRELSPPLRAARFQTDAAGSPLDPSGVPYRLLADKCQADLSEQSEILRNY